tara:strand:+ start:4817 stop:5380 length:564 start_codon:yes stop_codon:yes gene_type:complete
MTWYALLLISAGLSIDAFTTTVALTLSGKRDQCPSRGKFAFVFGYATSVMTVFGWLASSNSIGELEPEFQTYIGTTLCLVAVWWLIQANRSQDAGESSVDRVRSEVNEPLLWLLASASAVDAGLFGVHLGYQGEDIQLPALCVGGMSGFFAYLAHNFAKLIGTCSPVWIAYIPGMILLFLGGQTLLR